METKVYILLFVYSISVSGHKKYSADETVIVLDDGVINGTKHQTLLGRTYFSFEGIPYAQAPVGKLRYRDPVPVKHWKGVKEAKKPGNKCLQLLQEPLPQETMILGSEDCLYLNVYTPKISAYGKSKRAKFDVVVFIHGGSFMFGGGSDYGPQYYLDKDIVFVTLNYRVGVFGFLSTGDAALPGNLGLKDQVLVLKWIQRNIHKFGGNRHNVIITGHSAGGASVSYHMLSPRSKGLFKKAVSFSGTAFDPWALAEDVPAKTKQLAAALNCSRETSWKMIDCLRKCEAHNIIKLTPMFFGWLYSPFSPFAPIIEVENPTAVIIKHPVEILKSGEANTVPWITSVTKEDGLYPVAQFIGNTSVLEDLNSNYLRIFPYFLDYNYTLETDRHDEVSTKIKTYYFGEKQISEDTSQELIKMATDRFFDIGDQLMAEMYSKYSNGPVFFYEFGYRGLHSFSEFFSLTSTNYGVAHGDDICYLMTCPFFNASEAEQDRRMIHLMVDIFSKFYSTGSPEIPEELNTVWEPIKYDEENENFNLLYFDKPDHLYTFSDNDIGNRTFWASLGIQENEGMW